MSIAVAIIASGFLILVATLQASHLKGHGGRILTGLFLVSAVVSIACGYVLYLGLGWALRAAF